MFILNLTLFIVGALIGPLNIALSFGLGGWIHPSAFYEKLGFFQTLLMWQYFWFAFIGVPGVLSTGIMLIFSRRLLLEARTLKQHILWGVFFGVGATVLSTFFVVLAGALYNHLHHLPGLNDSALGWLVLAPGSMILSAFFIVIFAPAILISGSFYGVLAMKLKQRFLTQAL